MNAWDHALVGVGTDRDLVNGADAAVNAGEAAAQTATPSSRDYHTAPSKETGAPQAVEPAAISPKSGKKKAAVPQRKASIARKFFASTIATVANPMTVDEAMLEIDASQITWFTATPPPIGSQC